MFVRLRTASARGSRAGARRTDRLERLADRGVRPLSMDVSDEDSMRSRVERILAETGRIDVLISNAGYGSYGAIEALSDCLRIETRPFGINVVVIGPGGIKTEWGEIAAQALRKVSGDGPYADHATAMARTLGTESRSRPSSPPSVLANAIASAVTAQRPKTGYAVGFGAKPLIAIRRILPDRGFDELITRATGVRS
jgi:NAD(P)-dependent dehydrogenase (short-subunit alcohol dehydrogenase family)